MPRAVQRIGAILMALQGAGHTFIATPMVFTEVNQKAVWFAGAGFAMIFLGLLNLAAGPGTSLGLRWAVIASNFLWLVLMVGLLSTSRSFRVLAAVIFPAACLAGSVGSVLTGKTTG